MEKSGYERYGLSGNPFRDLSSENLEDVELYHVNQSIDKDLSGIVDEIFGKENKAVIGDIGGSRCWKDRASPATKKKRRSRMARYLLWGGSQLRPS